MGEDFGAVLTMNDFSHFSDAMCELEFSPWFWFGDYKSLKQVRKSGIYLLS